MSHRAVVGAFIWCFCLHAAPRARITRPVDYASTVRVRQPVHPFIANARDLGRVDPGLELDRMILVLKTSPEQEAEINGLLAAQQDSSSPQFHSWLTPAEFGEEFGLANEDIEKIVAWLQSRGLRVDKVAQGRRTLEFSGETRQVEAAFRCELHRYEVNGEIHLANANAEISIPAGLAPAIEGVLSLHDFHSQPQHRVSTATPKFNTDPAGMRFRLTISRTSTMSRRFGRLSQMAPDRASQLSGARMSI